MTKGIVGAILIALCSGLAFGQAPTYRAWVVPPLGGEGSPLAAALVDRFSQAGYETTVKTYADLCDAAQLKVSQVDVLVLGGASTLPADSMGPIEAYLKEGGDIVALDAPMWRKQLVRDGDTWVDREEYRKGHAAGLLQHVIFDFKTQPLDGWQRTCNDMSIPTVMAIEPGQTEPIGSAVHVTIPQLKNWDTLAAPIIPEPFPANHTLTVFQAKGGPQTNSLCMEWTEKDGSRWIASVSLTSEWQLFVLDPSSFHYWESVPARAGDHFHPENATQMRIGLALTHTPVTGGPQEYWLGPFGTAERTPEHEKVLVNPAAPSLDTLSPGYKYFPVRDAATLVARADQFVAPNATYALPMEMLSPHPRAHVGGFDKGRNWRWSSLLEARAADGQWRGTPGTILVNADGPYKGGVWVAFGISSPAWYTEPAGLEILSGVAKALRRGVFFLDGGSNFYTYFEGQGAQLGARVVNVSKEVRTGLSAHLDVKEPDTGTVVFEKDLPIAEIASGALFTASEAFSPQVWPLTVTVQLKEGDQVFDYANHRMNVWKPKEQPAFITVKDGEFLLNGQRWRPHGVNYMPSSGIAVDDQNYFEYWLGAAAYDPEVIQRDLTCIAGLGMNAISVFLHFDSNAAQNLPDLLRRAESLGLKANVSLRPGTPMEFEWDKMQTMIQSNRLAQSDTVFAYDLAWEPMWGDQAERKRWDPQWTAWIVERYGSVENAEKDWEFAAPRDAAGVVTNPPGQQLCEDGGWRRLSAAYRRFTDTLLYEKYSQARRLVRSADPNHLVSFRMTEAGDPTLKWDKQLPYDFPYLAAAVDILEPEAYGRIGDWERVKPGWFQREYARWAAPHLPMVWAEAGVSAWSQSEMTATPALLGMQSEFFGNLYKLTIDSAANGIIFWWFPGGYRTNERSDYGIVDPGNVDRPSTGVIRTNAQPLLTGASLKPVDIWLEIDRDLYPAGVAGIYDAVQGAFWEAIAAGKTPGLKTAGTGTTSADCPLLAVGNTPCNGNNPPKFLDAFVDTVETIDAAGAVTPVLAGTPIPIVPGAPLHLRVAVTNLGEAQWLPPATGNPPGGVYLIAEGTQEGRIPLSAPAPRFSVTTLDIVVTPSAEAKAIVLTFEAEGRVRFGSKYVIGLSATPQ